MINLIDIIFAQFNFNFHNQTKPNNAGLFPSTTNTVNLVFSPNYLKNFFIIFFKTTLDRVNQWEQNKCSIGSCLINSAPCRPLRVVIHLHYVFITNLYYRLILWTSYKLRITLTLPQKYLPPFDSFWSTFFVLNI